MHSMYVPGITDRRDTQLVKPITITIKVSFIPGSGLSIVAARDIDESGLGGRGQREGLIFLFSCARAHDITQHRAAARNPAVKWVQYQV